MRIEAYIACRPLHFAFTARTSRNALTVKPSWYVRLVDADTGREGVGECGYFPGLSPEAEEGYGERLRKVVAQSVAAGRPEGYDPVAEPSLAMGLESAFAALEGGLPAWGPIEINGLVWIDTVDRMLEQVAAKVSAGFRTAKLKIGANAFADELALLRTVREDYPASRVTLRLDANGAFSPAEALGRLEQLARHDIDSIEQPIMAGQRAEMARVARNSPIPVALDEELIGCCDPEAMLDAVQPHCIVIKPTLHGGLDALTRWAGLARERGLRWWATSALESNVGLDAIARRVAALGPEGPQGLGTGQIYTDNLPSPVRLRGPELSLDPAGAWDYSSLQWHRV